MIELAHLLVCHMLVAQDVGPSVSEVETVEPRREAHTTVTWSLWKTTVVENMATMDTVEIAPLGEYNQSSPELTAAERRVFRPTQGYRSFVEAIYAADADFDVSLGLTLSRDVADVLTGLAGGVQMGGFVVRAESSTFHGAVAPRMNVAMPPDIDEATHRFATARAGYHAFTKEGFGHGFVLGGAVNYHRAPAIADLRWTRGNGDADGFEDFSSVFYPESRYLIVGVWGEFDTLRGIMADDGSDHYSIRLIDTDSAILALGVDMSTVMGPAVRWLPSDLDEMMERITGRPYFKPGTGIGIGGEMELRGGIAAAFDIATFRLGLQLGMQFSLAYYATRGSGVGLKGLEPDSAVAGSPGVGNRVLWGPYLRVSAQL